MEEDPKQRELGIAILQLMQILDAIYGVYLDSGAAFHQFRSFLIQSQKQTHAITGLSMEEIDERLFSYGEGHASTGDRVLHQATQKEVKKRNEKDGQNQRFFANMCLIAIYSYWEDTYRGKFAELNIAAAKKDILPFLRNPMAVEIWSREFFESLLLQLKTK